MTRRPAAAVVALFAAVSLYLVPVYPHYSSANDLSRWATVASLVERGTLETSWTEPLIGPLVDASRVGDRVYSNKAPGLALLALPGYLAVRPLLGPPTHANLRWSLYAMRLVAVTLPAVLLGLLVARRSGGDPLATATVLFATPVFVYGSLLFAHVTTALLLLAAFELAFPGGGPARPRAAGLAGALAGLATLADYVAVIPTAVLALGLLAGRGGWRRALAFAAGGAPLAALLAAYNHALFGSALSLSSLHEAYANTAALRQRGVLGVGVPTLASAYTLLASPSRGLLFFSPVLAFGAVALWPRGTGEDRRRAAVRLALVASFTVAMLGYPESGGGWCVGARYLVPVVPFLALAAHERGARAGAATGAALAFSTVLCVTPLLTFPFAPAEFELLHAALVRPLLLAGFATPTLGALLAPPAVALLPVPAAVAAALWLALRGGGRRAAAAAAAGALLALVLHLLPAGGSFSERALRALLLDTHFVPAGRLERLAAESPDPRERAQLAGLATLSAATRSIAPDDWPYR